MRGADVLVKLLIDHGVTHIFGVPGDTSMAFHDALRLNKDKITHVLCRDERHASYAADAYSRLTGKIGVVEVPSGGGALYVVPGVSEANGSNIPLLCIASEITMTSDEMNALTDCNQVDLFASSSKWNTKIQLSQKIPQMVRKAIRTATSGVPGACVLTFPENILREPFTGKESDIYGNIKDGRWQEIPAVATMDCAEDVYKLISNAKKPVILAGGGCHHAKAYEQLDKFAREYSIPVVSSIDGKGSVAETEYYSVGVVGANGALEPANEVVMNSDFILILGSKLDKVTTMGEKLIPEDAVIVQVDINEFTLANVLKVQYPVLCDINGFLQQMNNINKNPEAFAEKHKEWMDFIKVQREKKMEIIAEDYSRTSSAVVSAKIFECLEKITDENAVFCGDAGTPTPYISSYLLQKKAGKQAIIPRAHGALGYALGSSIGAQVARPDAKVICMVGDASFAMSLGELETAKRLQLPIIFINFQNNCYGWIKTIQKLYYEENYFGVDFSSIDAVKIAEGFGIKGKHIHNNDEIEEVLTWAVAQNEPIMINVLAQDQRDFIPPVYQWKKDAKLDSENREKLVY